MTKSIFFSTITIILFFQQINAQLDSIQVNNNKLNISNLKQAKSKYLVYMEKPDGSLLNLSIWERQVKLTKDNIIIEQYWKTPDSSTTRYVYSENNKSDFAPQYHYSKWGNKIEAFDFMKNRITGSDSIPNNIKNNFNEAYSYKPYNWELDLEIMETLPYNLGKTFLINFYHPGSKASPSTFYEYKVLKKEVLKSAWKEEIECWVLEIIYDKESKSTFWISTTSLEVLKMVEHYKQFTRYKYKF